MVVHAVRPTVRLPYWQGFVSSVLVGLYVVNAVYLIPLLIRQPGLDLWHHPALWWARGLDVVFLITAPRSVWLYWTVGAAQRS